MENLKIGHKIKKLRELKNLTQEHMANSIGISQGAYSRMELVYNKQIVTYIDLSNLSEGVYLFKAGTEMQDTFKIIKQ